MMMRSYQTLCSALEPLLRRVVQEEVELVVARAARHVFRSPSLKIQAAEASSYQLIFNTKLSLPIFTGSKIVGEDYNPLQILLVDSNGQEATLPFPIKIELVALNGDFLSNDQEEWTSVEFESNIERERPGKRPLLAGDVLVTLRKGVAHESIGDFEFTDNSSWIRSRNFRVGARVAPGTSLGMRIKEARTEAFSVKDHRGELYKKHHPPYLHDEVWRLERIGKDGAFHKRLVHAKINSVQDFLKLSIVDPGKLRTILGQGMSEKIWEVTMNHAMTCVMGNKRYVHQSPHSTLILNPICQVEGIIHNGQTYATHTITGRLRALAERMALDAYCHWNQLEEVDPENAPSGLMAQGVIESRHDIVQPSSQYGDPDTGFVQMVPLPDNNVRIGHSDWPQNLSRLPSMIVGDRHLFMSDSMLDDDSSPTLPFLLES
ncbi:protein SAR DEFICIENT 1-like isoform X2 [Tasmannia lanceolata]